MADFGLNIHVREGTNDGPPIPHALVLVEPVPAYTDEHGNVEVSDFLLTVTATGFRSYVKQPYRRPSLQGPVPISLQRAEEEPAPVPLPPPPPPPASEPDDSPEPTAAYVARVKARLVAAGEDLSGPCGAFKITMRAAWGLASQGWGLVESLPPHNNCLGYKVDVLMHRDGAWVDMIASSETDNVPAWNYGPGLMPLNVWRPPVQP